jgi:primosomal protein N' (replication factor Y)
VDSIDKYAKVVVRNNSIHTDNLFTYKIPEYFDGKIKLGHRILVPFGRGNKPVEAFVFGFEDSLEESYKIKDVVELLDELPIFTSDDLRLIKWMKNRYLCTYIDCVNLLYPKGYKLNNYKVISLSEDVKAMDSEGFENLLAMSKEEEKEILEKLYYGKDRIKQDKFKKLPNILNVVNRLENRGFIRISWEYDDHQNDKNICYVSLNRNILEGCVDGIDEYISENKIRLGKNQKNIIEFLKQNKDAEINDLIDILEVSKSSISSLNSKGIINFEFKPYYREPKSDFNDEKKTVVLNEEQMNAVELVNSQMFNEGKKPYLIHGITGSGKTEVYMEIIAQALKEGLSSIFLVPEISLTPQTISRVKNRFGHIVGVFHSKLSEGEKHDVYRAIKDGKIRILIGARSALFAPFTDLGVIIIDEAHESSYKADSNPKYNAIEVARYMALKNNITLVLGSATPSIEEYYRAMSGEYTLIDIKKRANEKPLPKIEVIDMKGELDLGNTSMFSTRLVEELRETISRGEQSILFLNRRGYGNFVSCKKCGYVFKCDNCDISLTYHKNNNTGVCHYCGYGINIPSACPECGDTQHLSSSGTGTEKIEEQLMGLVPEAKILRLDKDTTSAKGSLENILNRFRKSEANVLIGTQMLSKGLDFDNVTLVGILSADMILNFPDFRSFETTFQLITQVSGRAGRADKEGKVVLQTYDTESYAIRRAISYDYQGFYEDEIKVRKAFEYVPFNNLMRVVVSGKDEGMVKKNIFNLHSSLEYLLKARGISDLKFILGPSPCSIGKINSNYRWQILFKDDDVEINLLKGIIKYICITKRDTVFTKDVNLSIDINPSSML